MTVEALTELFAKLGARAPDGWARSQVTEGIPQLARFLFLRQAWRHVISEEDRDWIKTQLEVELDAPGGVIAPALGRLLSPGASESDLTGIVRVMQWRLLADFCHLLDDPGDVEDEAKDISWRLFQNDNNGRPTASIDGLHESVLEVEPSG